MPIGGTVPSIDQMLRPMGQLEAFVNTISMDTVSVVDSTDLATPTAQATTNENVTTVLHTDSTFTSDANKVDMSDPATAASYVVVVGSSTPLVNEAADKPVVEVVS